MPERQAAFPVGNIVHERTETATGFSARRFDLDHVGAQVGQQLAAKLALLVADFQHAQAVQRARQTVVGGSSVTLVDTVWLVAIVGGSHRRASSM